MNATALHFDKAAHRYSLDGRDLVSVTQALTEAGFIDPRWYTEDAALRGTYVHVAIALHAAGDLAVESIDPALGPYFDAYLAFRQESGFVVLGSEERVCDPLMGYAGTLDLRGCFNDRIGVDVIDIKTGSIPSWVGYQTAAYARLVTPTPRRRWSLNLCANGTYRLDPLTKRTDESVFLAALLVAQAKRGWL